MGLPHYIGRDGVVAILTYKRPPVWRPFIAIKPVVSLDPHLKDLVQVHR